MERTGFLIEKLLEDYRNGANPPQLLVTLGLIQKELVVQHIQVGKRIAVVMPGMVQEQFADDPGELTLSYKEIPEPVEETVAAPVIEQKREQPVVEQQPVQPVMAKVEPEPVVEKIYVQQEPDPDPVPEIKVQAVIKEIKQDINETMAVNGKSLNDRLAGGSNEKEISHSLSGEPIKDLRKGIGLNDRYVFVNELFRGDETMYERSIKTINSFNIYAEAQYWMERELKIKLGWDDNNHTVKQFYALVTRRFS